ncbi:MAG: transglycosylase SLT domain-containing protein [Ignavibacteria bacterium]|nr:transglycosylase SLT domain-containing protein [Ignavibacteria bacterium]
MQTIILTSCFVLSFLLSTQFVSCAEPSKIRSQPQTNVTLKNEDGNYARYLASLKFPDYLSFCGERVPLDIPEVRERAEREFYINLQTPGQLILYIKRAGRYFPLFEKILKEDNAPDDLKYLAVAESALYMARSTKDAVGMWQFIPATGKRMGLQIDEYVDERRHPEKSTRAAIEYLRSGYKKYKSWTLAAAGYNMGHENVGNNLDFQEKTSFYDLYLNEETSRYVLRIAMVKELMEHADKYGLTLDKQTVYRDTAVKMVSWESQISDLSEWAMKHGTTYKDVKILNPWILKRNLPAPKNGSYQILIPK